MRRVLAVLALTVAACGDGPLPGGGDPPDAAPDADPYCHYDCFGYSECADGVVTTWEHAPIPCEYWEGECPHDESYQCERGCRTDLDQVGPFDAPEDLCEENRPKQVGDPCAEELDCRPEVATIHGDGTVTNVYLTCDLTAGQCVEREPPTIPDLYQGCGIEAPIAPPGTYVSGIEETTACSGGVCAYTEDSSETCVWQTCTARCSSDGECPPGTTCLDEGFAAGTCLPPDWQLAGITCQ